MANYQALYYLLFSGITHALEHFERMEWAEGIYLLQKAQQDAEAQCLAAEETKSGAR